MMMARKWKWSPKMCCEIRFFTVTVFLLLSVVGHLITGVHCADETMSPLQGKSITLTCPFDVTACGELHSIKWTKDTDTIAVVSGNGEVVNINNNFTSRISIDHSPNGPSTRMHLKNVQVSDEGVYVCESTFVEPFDSCNNLAVYNIDVKILVPPSAILVLDEDGNQLKNGTVLGPLREGRMLVGTCEVRGARPAPSVGWYRAGKRVPDTITIDESMGLFSVKSVFSLSLSRQELGATLECKIETPALDHTITNELSLDLQVRPTKISLTGVKHHTVQGTKVLLQCQVTGARPAANVTWYNSTRVLDPEREQSTISTQTTIQNDGTFDTLSQLIFTASRYENGAAFRCEADNIVMRDDLDKPIHETLVLEVLYPPVVTVRPENITINETMDFLLFCEYDANPASLVSVKWRKNGRIIRVDKDARYEGGNSEQTALLVKNASRHDTGVYSCELANAIGNDTSDNEIDVDVQYVPTVKLNMDPSSPIIENNESNVTLYCNVEEGNPSQLLKVRWFLDGQLLKELPECENDDDNSDDDDDLCGIDPSKMLLQNVGRDFLGNYSCEGLNTAGWGPRSEDSELIVYYEPGNATIFHTPTVAVKKKSVIFSCSVDDGGNPNATRYRWLRGDKPVMDIVMSNWTVDPIGLDSRTNFSCYAYNEGGEGTPATVFLDVHAPPTFIQSLNPYTGALYSTSAISISCRVECVPQCSISWFKDGVGVEETDDRYFINESYLPADHSTGDFESILSTLHFNMSAWPEERFDIFRDSANYSCVSSNNSVGSGVRSSTYFAVEYPPENATVSIPKVSVVEGTVPQQVLCSAKAFPEPSYEWVRNGESIMKGNVLLLKSPVQRDRDSGPFTCIAYNRHGNQSVDLQMDVQYRPNCTIQRKEINDQDTLICTAIGNPDDMDFAWTLMSENDTLDLEHAREEGASSYLILSDDFTVMRNYRCVANNSAGVGSYCEIDVAGQLLWWQRWDRLTLYIIIASVLLLLIAVIIICIVIICICRKRRRQDKYHTDMSINTTSQSAISATNQLLGGNTSPNTSMPNNTTSTAIIEAGLGVAVLPPEIPKSPPKWPLRPGVLVHVKGNTKQNICASRTGNQSINQTRPELNTTATTTISGCPGDKSGISNSSSTSATTALINRTEMQQKSPNGRRDEERGEIRETVDGGEEEPREMVSDIGIQVEENDANTDELVNFTRSNVIERILKRLRWKRERGGPGIGNRRSPTIQVTRNRILNRAKHGLFGSCKSTNSNTGLFESRRYRPAGIKYTSSVVTYKKPPPNAKNAPGGGLAQHQQQLDREEEELKRQELSHQQSEELSTPPSLLKTKNNTQDTPVHDKSSAAGDPLTEPGEYENLPFHGLQSAPNKSSFLSNNCQKSLKSTNARYNANVVRVAPRPKNPSFIANNHNYPANNSTEANSIDTINKYLTNPGSNGGNYGLNFNATLPPADDYYHQSTLAMNSSNFVKYQQPVYSQTVRGISTDSSRNPLNLVTYNPFMAKSAHKKGSSSSSSNAGGGGSNSESGNNISSKFNSLKSSLGIRKTPQFYSMRLSNNSHLSKSCKRHNSFNQQQQAENERRDQPPHYSQQNSNGEEHHHSLYYEEQPLYENLTDSIQIHELSASHQHQPVQGVINENQFKQQQVPPPHKSHMEMKLKKAHHKSCDLIERSSIYRSDSGISNSSYECITPVPAPRTTVQAGSSSGNGGDGGKSSSKSHHHHQGHKKHKKSTPVYMNISSQLGGGIGSDSLRAGASSTTGAHHKSHQKRDKSPHSQTSSSAHNHEYTAPPQTNPFLTTTTATATSHAATKTPTSHKSLTMNEKSNSSSRKSTPKTSNNNNSLNNTSSMSMNIHNNSCNNNSLNGARRQQILMPKELFPASSSGGNCSSNSTSSSTSSKQRAELMGHTSSKAHKTRPIKLPLRKHHSFHFQPSQTVAGSKPNLHHQHQHQQNQQCRQDVEEKNDGGKHKSYLQTYYKSTGGPLVFKPIMPVPKTSHTHQQPIQSSSTSSTPSPTHPITISSLSSPPSCKSSTSTLIGKKTSNYNLEDSSSTSSPRIKGASLKRHHSSADPSWVFSRSMNDANLMADYKTIPTISSANNTLESVLFNSTPGYGQLAPLSNCPSSNSNSIVKRLHYVELDDSFARSNPSYSVDAGGGGYNFYSDDENVKRNKQRDFRDEYEPSSRMRLQNGYGAGPGGGGGFHALGDDDEKMNLQHFKEKYFLQQPPQSSSSSSSKTPKELPKRTQYATLKFNEPLSPADLVDDLEYADIDFRSYGPINYKAASIYALVKKQKNGALK